jgi:hypothetical protein
VKKGAVSVSQAISGKIIIEEVQKRGIKINITES